MRSWVLGMQIVFHRFKQCLLALFVLCGLGASSAMADANIDVVVLSPLLGGDGITPVADGSWIMIIASADNTIDPMQQAGDGYIANSTTGDDVIIGMMQVDAALRTYGVEAAYSFLFDDTPFNYVYIRVFDSAGPLTGELYWGTSDIVDLDSIQDPGLGNVYYFEVPGFTLTNQDNFVIIPEPSTANLILLVGGMAWAMRANIRRKKKTASAEEQQI